MLFSLVLAASLGPACADPHGDLEDFKSRTDEAIKNGGGGGEGGGGGVPPLATNYYDIGGQFVFGCTTVATPAAAQVLRFLATVELTPAGGSPGGTLTLSLQPLSTSVTATAADVVGASIPADAAATVSPTGEFSFRYASVAIPGTASPLGRDILLQNAAFSATSQHPDVFCARFGAQVAQPIQLPLTYDNPINSCAGARVGADGTLPDLADYLGACTTATANLPAAP